MKNILMLLAMSLFIVAMFLLADTKIEYALIAIVTACALVLSSCLIDKEEENINLKTQVATHALRGTQLEQQILITMGNLERANTTLERYEHLDDMLRHRQAVIRVTV
jgi:hypothetical protein